MTLADIGGGSIDINKFLFKRTFRFSDIKNLNGVMGGFVEMQEDSSNSSSKPAGERIDPVVAEALFWVVNLFIDKVLEDDLNESDCWIVASTTDIASNSNTTKQCKSNYQSIQEQILCSIKIFS